MTRFFLGMALIASYGAYAMEGQDSARMIASPAQVNSASYTVEQLVRAIPKVAIVKAGFDLLIEYDNIFKSNITMKEAAFKIGVIACVGSILELSFDGIPYVVKKIPSSVAYGSERLMSGLYRACGLPTPIGEERLAHQSAMFEDVINAVTKQQTSGSVMLRNVRVEQDGAAANEQELQWSFYVQFAEHRLSHIVGYLRDSLQYYRPTEGQKGWSRKVWERFSPDSVPDLVCTIDEIIANINHIAGVLKAAHTQDDLDINHLKMLSANTKTLFKELKILIVGGRKQEGPSTAFNS